jgi:hypothetical protein
MDAGDRTSLSLDACLAIPTCFVVSRLVIVNLCQPSHEFTFGVGIDLISKLMILSLIICQVHTREDHVWFED